MVADRDPALSPSRHVYASQDAKDRLEHASK
jgi:hypothetical protein